MAAALAAKRSSAALVKPVPANLLTRFRTPARLAPAFCHSSLLLVIRLFLPLLLSFSLPAADLDRDGIDDQAEQRLLNRFRPRFLISPSDCGGFPVAIQPGLVDPVVLPHSPPAIYGQVFRSGADVEIHYYHLWERDCGRLGHQWDVEHVAVLTRRGRARFWFAAAHQGTVCDAGHGGRARTLLAEDRGAIVWVSQGKHASFLSEKSCALGCGGDRCGIAIELEYGPVVNIGEPGRPLNGALWTAFAKWPLSRKMTTAFPPEVVAQLDRDGLPSLDPTRLPVHSVILGGNTAIGGIERAGQESGDAVGVSARKVNGALRRARGWLADRVK